MLEAAYAGDIGDKSDELDAVTNKVICNAECQDNANAARTEYRKVLGIEHIREIILDQTYPRPSERPYHVREKGGRYLRCMCRRRKAKQRLFAECKEKGIECKFFESPPLPHAYPLPVAMAPPIRYKPRLPRLAIPPSAE